jgi:hypothetical protein
VASDRRKDCDNHDSNGGYARSQKVHGVHGSVNLVFGWQRLQELMLEATKSCKHNQSSVLTLAWEMGRFGGVAACAAGRENCELQIGAA